MRLRRLPEEAADDVLEKAHGLLIHKLGDHVAENSTDCVEALISLTNVLQSHVVKEDLLDDEDRHGLAELGARLHDTQTKRNDFGRE